MKQTNMVLLVDANRLLNDSADESNPALQTTTTVKESQRVRKGVHFSTSKQVFSYRRPKVPNSEIWYGNEDFSDFRKKQMSDAKKTARVARIVQGQEAMIKAYHKCYNRESMVSERDLDHLSSFLQEFDCNGLERFTLRELFREKKNRRTMMYEVLHDVLGNDDIGDPRLKAELLRRELERVNKPSCLFAHVLASAAQRC